MFTNENVRQLTGLLEGMDHANNRGRPLTPIKQVCIALDFYGGGHLMWGGEPEDGLVGFGQGQSRSWSRSSFVCQQIKNVLQLRSACGDRSRLPGFAFGVDCTIAKFEDAPWVIPPNTQKRWYRTSEAAKWPTLSTSRLWVMMRAAFWTLLLTGREPTMNDARIWNASGAKQVISQLR